MNASGEEKRKRRWLGGKIFLSAYIIISAALLVFGALLAAAFAESEYVRNNCDFENPVKATVTKVTRRAGSEPTATPTYTLFYEYTSDDGVYYCGWQDDFKDKAEAERHVGELIDIYIDGKGVSAAYLSESEIDVGWLVGFIILLTAGTATVAVLVIPHRWKPPKQKDKKLPTRGVSNL